MRSKNKTYRQSRKSKSNLGGLSLIIGLLLGAGSSYVIYQTLSKPEHWKKISEIPQKAALDSLKVIQNQVQIKPVPEPRFEFYNTLPKLEVAQNQEPVQAVKNTEIKKPLMQQDQASTSLLPRSTGTTNSYYVQGASFANIKDADALKAKLTLQGFQPKILSGNSQFKIIFGPFSSEHAAQAMRKKLAEKQIYSAQIITQSTHKNGE
ncbi:MAG: SPOR domain-containing protein [Gammaproteobacteria bacterium]